MVVNILLNENKRALPKGMAEGVEGMAGLLWCARQHYRC